MGNILYNKNNFNPLCTEITDYYDLDKFEDIFYDEIHKYNKLDNFSDLQKDLETFLLLNKNEAFLFYKTFIDTNEGLKIFIKTYFLQRIGNKIRYASLQICDLFYNDINYIAYTKNIFAQKFDFLNINFNQINFISIHQTKYTFNLQ